MPASNVTDTANAAVITYTITYNLDGGALASGKSNPTSYTVETATFTLNNPTKTGYTFAGWTGSNGTTAQTSVSVAKGTTGNLTFTANWVAGGVAYKVQHWQQNVDGGDTQNSTNFTLKETENLTGTTGAKVTPAVKSYTGFTAPSTQTVTIAADGSTVVNYYYTRNSYTVTLNEGTGIATVTGAGTYKYGASVTINATLSSGYSWSKWTGTHSTTTQKYTFTMPASNVTDTANAVINEYVQAIYSVDDNSLTYIVDTKLYQAGETYNGKAITAVYTGFETATYSETTVPWSEYETVIESVVFEDEITPVSTAYWYDGFTACTAMDLAKLKTENVANMAYMFRNCSSLSELDVSGFNTENVTSMAYMFRACSGLTELDLSNFTTTSLTNMHTMFADCTGLTSLDVTSFDTSKVWDMNGTFRNCSSLTELDVSNFNTEKVTTTYSMFQYSGLVNLDLSSFYTPLNQNTQAMFAECPNLETITWDSSKFVTGEVMNMEQMFANSAKLTTVDVSGFNTEKVTNMRNMFANCESVTKLDVSHWKTHNVTTMENLFDDCHVVGELDVSGFNTEKVTNMRGMFQDCYALTELDVSGFNTAAVTDMELMFSGCQGVAVLDVSGFNTGNVLNMDAMFNGCNAITQLDVSGFNTEKVTDMGKMFRACNSLSELDLSSFNTAAVTDTAEMFKGCADLTTIYATDAFNTDNVTSHTEMFLNCSSLVGGAGTKYSATYVDKTRARIDTGVAGSRGYFTDPATGGIVAQAIYTASDNTLTFVRATEYSAGDKYDGKTITAVYTGFETETYTETTVPWYSYRSSIKSVDMVDTMKPISTAHWFDGMSALEEYSFTMNMSRLTNTSYMFRGTQFSEMSFGSINFANVTNMEGMFAGCTSLTTLDLSGFNTENVANMSNMFSGSSNLTTIAVSDSWSTENVTSSGNMFAGCTSIIGGAGTTFTSAHIDAEYAKVDGGSADPGYFTGVIESITGATLIYNNVSIGETVEPRLTIVPAYAASYQSIKYEITAGSDYATIDETTGVVTAVAEGTATVLATIVDANGNTITVEGTVAITTAQAIYCASDNSLTFVRDALYEKGGTFKGKTITAVYTGFEKTEYTLENLPWYSYRTKIKTVTFEDVMKPVSTRNWFNGMTALTSYDIKLDTSVLTSTAYMFRNVTQFSTMSFENLDFSNVTNMQNMFAGCSGLTTLDISGFNTAKVENMSNMFNGCTKLTTIAVSDSWSTDSVTTSNNMFAGCTSLVGGAGTGYNSSYIDATYARVDGGTSAPGYLTSNASTAAVAADVESMSLLPDVELPDGVTAGEAQTISAMPDVAKLNEEAEAIAAENTTLYGWLVDSGMAKQIVLLEDFEAVLNSVYGEESEWEMTITPLYQMIEESEIEETETATETTEATEEATEPAETTEATEPSEEVAEETEATEATEATEDNSIDDTAPVEKVDTEEATEPTSDANTVAASEEEIEATEPVAAESEVEQAATEPAAEEPEATEEATEPAETTEATEPSEEVAEETVDTQESESNGESVQ